MDFGNFVINYFENRNFAYYVTPSSSGILDFTIRSWQPLLRYTGCGTLQNEDYKFDIVTEEGVPHMASEIPAGTIWMSEC